MSVPYKYIHWFLGVWKAPWGDSYVPISLDISRPAALSVEDVATGVLWKETNTPLPPGPSWAELHALAQARGTFFLGSHRGSLREESIQW